MKVITYGSSTPDQMLGGLIQPTYCHTQKQEGGKKARLPDFRLCLCFYEGLEVYCQFFFLKKNSSHLITEQKYISCFIFIIFTEGIATNLIITCLASIQWLCSPRTPEKLSGGLLTQRCGGSNLRSWLALSIVGVTPFFCSECLLNLSLYSFPQSSMYRRDPPALETYRAVFSQFWVSQQAEKVYA